ncbi:hypothetical protein C9374_009385 [Naegleria lovaniensis]|uniref:Uncharacterized protein n=1 Tax=Naegleria lovaniensis TaxID=51637 RepID=A0AA88KK44_NAELO|nr:uncharacterized protein C9374_009385 [Naegleria lovaniensis]KAG2377474.1 hypothetical protein C9374_009385 [Naegleria lovaniensis]
MQRLKRTQCDHSEQKPMHANHGVVEERIKISKCHKRNRLLKNLFYRSIDCKFMGGAARRENPYTVGKKVDLIPITSIEDEKKLLKRCASLGFTRNGHHLIAYTLEDDIAQDSTNASFEHQMLDSTKKRLFLVFFQFDVHKRLKLDVMFQLVTNNVTEILFKKNRHVLPQEMQNHGTNNATNTNFPTVDSNGQLLSNPDYKTIVKNKNISLDDYIPKFMVNDIHFHVTESIEEDVFFVYQYCTTVAEKIFLLSIFPNILNISEGNIYSVTIRYSSSTDINTSIFNPMFHVVNYWTEDEDGSVNMLSSQHHDATRHYYSFCTSHSKFSTNKQQSYLIALPTSNTIELFLLKPTAIHSKFQVHDPFERDILEDHQDSCIHKGLSDNVSFEYVPLLKRSDLLQTSFTHASQFYHFHVEEFLMSTLEKGEKITDYGFKIIKCQDSTNCLFFVVVVDVISITQDYAERRVVYHCCIKFTNQSERCIPTLKIIHQQSTLIDPKFSTFQFAQTLCVMYLKMEPLRQTNFQTHTNENLFTTGQSSKAIPHPLLPLCIVNNNPKYTSPQHR